MAYRTKIYNILNEKYMKPILRFIGLSVDKSKELSMLAWDGDNVDEKYDRKNHKVIEKGTPNWFVNDKKDPPKIYTFIESQEEYLRYKKNSDKLEYLNPFAKWANAQTLLLLMIPNIYERYCKVEEDENEIDDYIDELLYDRVVVTQDVLLKHVNIKYFPVERDVETGELVYHYEINISRENGEENTLISKSTNKSACLIMLMINIISIVDGIYDSEDFKAMQTELEDLIEKYMHERELNYKEFKKLTIDKDLGLSIDENSEEKSDEHDKFEQDFESLSVEDLVNASNNPSASDKEEIVDPEKKQEPTINNPIDITNMYKDDMHIGLSDDDTYMILDYHFL